MDRRTFLTASVAALACPAIGRAQNAAPLKFVPNADLAVLDPIWTTAYVTRNHGLMVFDTLYGQDDAFKAHPQMVAGHQVDADGLRWTLTLRDGLKFHDDQPVLARDCVASIKRWAARDSYGMRFAAIANEISAPDDKTIVIRLKEPFPQLPDALGKSTNNICAIMPERIAQTDPFKQVTEMIGSGPYRFLAAERIPGAKVVYERFTDYRPRPDGVSSFTAGPKVANLARVEWITMPDPSAASGALQAGEIDWWELPIADLLPLLKANREITVTTQDPTGYIGLLRLNHLHPPFNDPRVRRAVLAAVDQSEFMQAIVGDDRSAWRDGVGFFCPETPMATAPSLKKPDLDRARAEIKAAGFAGAPVVIMGATDLESLRAVGDVTSDLMSKLGFKVDYQSTDFGTLVQRRTSKEPPSRGGWNGYTYLTGGLDQASPITHAALWSNGASAAPGWPDSPKIETLRTEWLKAPDLEAQKKVAAQIERQAEEDVPYVPAGQYLYQTAHRKSVSNLPKYFPIFWGIEKS